MMWITLEKTLAKKDREKYNRYIAIKKMMNYCDTENEIGIDKRYYRKILASYIDSSFQIGEEKSITYTLYIFFEKVVDLYILKKLPRYNFVVDELKVKPFLKEWLKEKKDNIRKFIDFYVGNSGIGSLKNLFKNDYFDMFQIHWKRTSRDNKWLSTYPDSENIILRIVLEGKIYFNDGIILEEGFYMLSDGKSFLDKCTVLSDEINILFVVIKKSFINMFELIESDTKLKIKTNVNKEKLNRMMNSEYLKKHPFTAFESIMNFFEINLVKKEPIFLFFKAVEEEEDLNEVQSIILENINLDVDDILRCIERELMISEEILNSYLVKNLNITLRKWIIKLKLKFLLEESYFGNREIEEVRKKLAISNIKSLRYNLKTYYDISVKDLKRV